MESLSTYTRRRMTQAERADVEDVRYVPAALALRQRPGVPGIRSTFGTLSELLNGLRLMFSRLASHRCPNGHYCPPSLSVAAMQEITCPACGGQFHGPGAEELAFNSTGACRTCGGTGIVQTVNEATLVPDDSKTIDEGAVVVWGDAHVVAHEGHRTDDGRANRCAVPRPLAEGKGDRLPRRVEKTSRPLRQSAHAGTVGNGFQLLQRGQFRQELPCQGQGREGNEEAREISQGGRLPGLPWDKALGGRPHAETAGESVWTGQRQ